MFDSRATTFAWLLLIAMLNKLALIAAASAAFVGVSHEEAHAGPTANFGWHLTNWVGQPNGYCGGAGSVNVRVGYYGETAPRVGHTQDAAVLIDIKYEGDPKCASVTVQPSFELNTNDVARDPTQSVVCEWVQADGKAVALPDSTTSGCSNTPLPSDLGLKNVYGWATLAPGEGIRVYLPVTWLHPVRSTTFTGLVGDNLGPTSVSIPFAIEAGPQFSSFTTTNSGSNTTVQFSVTHHPDDAGDVVIEYGTSTNYSFATPVQQTSSNTTQQMTFVLTNLQPGTQYHYRVRYIVPYLGVTWTSDRTFSTDPGTIVLPPNNYLCFRRYGC